MTTDRELAQKDIQAALEALGRGDLAAARRLAEHAASLAPDWETPWLILAVRSDPEDHLALIQKALQANPASKTAQQALMWELERRALEGALSEVEPPPEPDVPLVGLMQDTPWESPAAPGEPWALPERQRAPRGAGSASARTKEQIARALSLQPEQPDGAASLRPVVPAGYPGRTPRTSTLRGKNREIPSLPVRNYVIISLGLALVIVIIAFSFLMRSQLTTFMTDLFGTNGCTQTLVLGTRSFEIRTLKLASNGSVSVPANQTDRVYWVNGTHVNVVIGLSAVPANFSLLSSLISGSTATITWSDCNSTTYTLQPPVDPYTDVRTLLNQDTSRLTIFLPDGGGAGGLFIQGDLLEQTINNIGTPNASSPQAEISIKETTLSPDQTTLTVIISITNDGQDSLTLNAVDVSLASGNGDPQFPINIEPSPPVRIDPGTTQIIYLVFPRPFSAAATLRVFTVEFSVQGY